MLCWWSMPPAQVAAAVAGAACVPRYRIVVHRAMIHAAVVHRRGVVGGSGGAAAGAARLPRGLPDRCRPARASLARAWRPSASPWPARARDAACCPMSMPGMDWAWTATGAASAVAASSVLINIVCSSRVRSGRAATARVTVHARGQASSQDPVIAGEAPRRSPVVVTWRVPPACRGRRGRRPSSCPCSSRPCRPCSSRRLPCSKPCPCSSRQPRRRWRGWRARAPRR